MNKTKLFIGTLYETVAGSLDPSSANAPAAGMLSVTMPQQGMDAGAEGYSEPLDFEYGGADVVASPQSHRRYEFNFSGTDVTTSTGIDQIKRLAAGEFGNGLIYFADPYNYTTNLLPPAWASPSLIRSGWRTIHSAPTGYSQIALANTTNQPRLSPIFNITTAANAAPADARNICVQVIPPDHTLHLGFSASATGTAVVRVRPIKLDGKYATPVDLTLLSWNGSTRMNTTFSGATYRAVEIYFARTSSAASTLTVTSAMAQLLPTGQAQSVSQFVAGQGHTGCKFETRALEEAYTYVDMGRKYRVKGLSATLVEVGTSVRYS